MWKHLDQEETCVQGLVLSRKNMSSENFSDKFRKFNIHKFFLKIRNFSLTRFLVLLAGKISADFSSEFLIGTQFDKSVEFSFQMSENFTRILRIFLGFFIGRTKPRCLMVQFTINVWTVFWRRIISLEINNTKNQTIQRPGHFVPFEYWTSLVFHSNCLNSWTIIVRGWGALNIKIKIKCLYFEPLSFNIMESWVIFLLRLTTCNHWYLI
jgi:hypothetical protein